MKKALGVLCVLLLAVIGSGVAHANVLDFPVGSSFWADRDSPFDFGGFHFSGYSGIEGPDSNSHYISGGVDLSTMNAIITGPGLVRYPVDYIAMSAATPFNISGIALKPSPSACTMGGVSIEGYRWSTVLEYNRCRYTLNSRAIMETVE